MPNVHDEVALIKARADAERAQVDNISRLFANASDSLRLYYVAAPYIVLILICSLYVIIAIAVNGWAESGFWFVVSAFGIPVALIDVSLVAMLIIETANEWDKAIIIRAKMRETVKVEPIQTLPMFPPRWFVLFLKKQYEETGELPTIDTINAYRKAQDNQFNRDVAQKYFEALEEWGAIEGREGHGKSAGKPVKGWDWMLDHAT